MTDRKKQSKARAARRRPLIFSLWVETLEPIDVTIGKQRATVQLIEATDGRARIAIRPEPIPEARQPELPPELRHLIDW